VVGHPIKHSASPAMQNAGIAALGLNWRYLAFDVPPTHLRAALAGAKAMRCIGLNFTVPHKVLALEMVDVLDESASTWGAVNTVRFEAQDAAGQWRPLREFAELPSGEVRAHGFNTDADAVVRALREDLALEPRGAKVLLVGTGGAGRVAASRLSVENLAELFVFDAVREKAEVVAAGIRQRQPGLKVVVGFPAGAVDLLLHATPLGLKAGDPFPLEGAPFKLQQARAVYDMIYRPAETPLLRAAKAAGCRTANGLGMLLYQGAKALEIWTGQPAPLAVMRRALEREVYGT
jgi:shikimate dehydrogenase